MTVCYTSIWLVSLRAIFPRIARSLLPVLIETLVLPMPIVTRKSFNKTIITLPRVGQYREIFRSLPRYRPSLRLGWYGQSRMEYLPVLPSQSCNTIYIYKYRYIYSARLINGPHLSQVKVVHLSSCLMYQTCICTIIMGVFQQVNMAQLLGMFIARAHKRAG